jgi:hypothetical protein
VSRIRPDQHGSAPFRWHRDFADARQRLHDWVATSGTRLERDRPTRQTAWPGEPPANAIEDIVISEREEDFVLFVVDDVMRRRKAEAGFFGRAGSPRSHGCACSADQRSHGTRHSGRLPTNSGDCTWRPLNGHFSGRVLRPQLASNFPKSRHSAGVPGWGPAIGRLRLFVLCGDVSTPHTQLVRSGLSTCPLPGSTSSVAFSRDQSSPSVDCEVRSLL